MRRTALLVLLAGACSSPSPIESHYNRGLDAYDRGDLATAISEFQLVTEDNPENYRAWFNLGVAYQDQDAHDPAERAYLKVLGIKADNGRAHVNLAAIYAKRGDPGSALRHLQLAADAEPDRAFPITAMGHYWEGRGHEQRAEELYRQAVERERTHVDSNYHLGALLAKSGRFEEGLDYLERALEVDPNDVPSLMEAGSAYARTGRRVKAIMALQRAELRARKIEPGLYLDLATLLEADGRLEDALVYLWRARDSGAQTDRREIRLYEKLIQRKN